MIDSLACGLVKTLGWLLCRLPPGLCVRLGQSLGWLASWLQPKRLHVGSLNLKAAFGARLSPWEARRIARQVFQYLGAGLIEMLRLPAMDAAYINRYVQIEGREHAERALASGRPIVFLTGHFGNWELCSITAALHGLPLVALARAQDKLPKLYRLLVSYRESKGCRVVHKGGAMRQLIKALAQRQLVGVVGDQASRQGLPIEFFGRPARFATGPFELARRSDALILPAFMHRIRGPHHRLVLEPPIDLSKWQGADDQCLRFGLERFVSLLSHHIEQDPAQWLWVHKRWKHTPTKHVLVLSDGKLGHLKQSLTVVHALRQQVRDVRERVVDVRYRHRLARGVAVAWAWLMPGGWGRMRCLQWTLSPSCFQSLASAYADVIVSCGASTAPVNVLLSRDTRARSVVIMNPRPIPLRAFSLAFVPVHDEVPAAANVIRTYGALNIVANNDLDSARQRLQAHPKFSPRAAPGTKPIVAVFLGGDTGDYHLTRGFVEALLRQVLAECEALNAACFITSSRRTPPDVERWLSEALAMHPRCWLLLLASRDALDGTVDGMLAWADVAVVTGESISMVSEACASGRHVIVVEPPLRQTAAGRMSKPQRFVRALAGQGYLRQHPLAELGHAIRRCLRSTSPPRRLDVFRDVQDAVRHLL